MKKFLLSIAVAFAATATFAQTKLSIGGGWNDGFVGAADEYVYQLEKQWGAAEFSFTISPTEYPSAVIEFSEACPENFQLNYTADGDPKYNVVPVAGNTSAEITFEGTEITGASLQSTVDNAGTVKIKSFYLVAADGSKKVINPSFTGWAGKDLSVTYSGTVKLNKQYEQLVISGATGKKAPYTLKIVSPEPLPEGIQFCIDYEDADSEWPAIKAGETEATVTTSREGATIKNFGIQRQADGEMTLTISAVYELDPTGIEDVEIASEEASFNLFGQQSNGKGFTVKGGKVYLVK